MEGEKEPGRIQDAAVIDAREEAEDAEASSGSLPHAQPKMPTAYDASSMVRNGEAGNAQNAAQEAGFTIGNTPDGLTPEEREEKQKKKDEEFQEVLSSAVEEQRERIKKEEWERSKIDLGDGGEPMTLGEMHDALNRITSNKAFWMARWRKEGLVKPGEEDKTWEKLMEADRILKEAKREGRELTKEEQEKIEEVAPLVRDEQKRSMEKKQTLQSEARESFPGAPILTEKFTPAAEGTISESTPKPILAAAKPTVAPATMDV